MLAATIIITSGLAAITQQTAFAAKPTKVTMCHITKIENGEAIDGATITVPYPSASFDKHLAHGDFLGACEFSS
jgi:hypothetical protein